jgi:DNA processing protein
MTQKKMTDYTNSENIEDINNLETLEIGINSNDYPLLLKNIEKAPKVLYALGNIKLLNKPAAAIVGTRKPSSKGKLATKKIAEQYGENGFVIVSGLALGVDAIAMESALSVGAPVIGVLPSPLDNIIPKRNRDLAERILKNNGVLISELSEGTKVQKYHYINRNRIISGISMITIIAETLEKGGTMHTVKFAKEQVRPIVVADIPTSGNKKLKDEGLPIFFI